MKKLILLLSLIFLVSGCISQSEQAIAEETRESGETIINSLPTAEEIESLIQEEIQGETESVTVPEDTESKTVEIDIIARQWEFVPDEITVNEGDTVVLHITSEDVTHGFSLPQFSGASGAINPGEETTIEFVADKAGTYDFHCSIFCGSGHGGMKGTLIVE